MTALGRRPAWRAQIAVLSVQILLILAIVIVWELLTRWRVIDPFYYGKPSEVSRYLLDMLNDGSLLTATWVTFLETLWGFALGMGIGTVLGFALWWSRAAAKVLEPFLITLNSVPKIIFAPIFLVLIGLGFAFKVVVAFAGVVIVALLSAYAGAKEADADLIDLVRSVGGNRWQVFCLIVVPTALPWVGVSMEINVGFALIGAVVAEFIASNEGLGYLAVHASGTFDMSLVLVSVIGLVVLAALLYGAVRLMESWVLPWRPSEARLQGR